MKYKLRIRTHGTFGVIDEAGKEVPITKARIQEAVKDVILSKKAIANGYDEDRLEIGLALWGVDISDIKLPKNRQSVKAGQGYELLHRAERLVVINNRKHQLEVIVRIKPI